MFKKVSFLVVIYLLLLAVGGIASAATVCWTNDLGNRRWALAGNWDPGRVPSSAIMDDAAIVKTGTNGPIFDVVDGPQSCWFLIIGSNGVAGEMWMNGGTFTAPWGLCFNKGGYAVSTLHMSGGTLNLTGSDGLLQIGRQGVATFNMSGGVVECVTMSIPYNTAASGVLNLDGGSVSADTLTLVTNGLINITKGKLILNGDKVSVVNGYVSSNLIIPYPGQTGHKIVNVDYDSYTAGKTTLTASRTELTQAYKPVPMDTHPNVDKSVILSWTPGDGAILHDLYIGINFNDVNDATEPLATLDTDVNSFANGFVSGQTYYWRVDEYDGSNTYKGQVWSFTVAYNPQASAPSPANGATGVEPNANLSWAAGDKAIAHDVYFSTSSSAVVSATDPNISPGRGRQTETSYEPNTLVLGRQYYWRIDEFDGTNVIAGDVWSFTVAPSIATEPKPADGARYVAKSVTLSWSAGYGAISHDVYIGTSSSDVNSSLVPLVTTGTVGYSPAGIELGQTYYWRIDEFDGGATHKGQVWAFTTEPAGSLRAFPGAEGYGAYATGGRGGDVYHVTNLTDDATNPQSGSLRYGIDTATGPRTIVFDVCGYIELQNRLEITKPYITIAGQTAPGQGVTLRKHDVRIYNTHDVIIRYIRVRVGKYSSGQDESQFGGLDALSIEAGTDIIIDHVSTSWGVDELMSITSDSNDITVQWCALTEPLNYYEHSKASLLRPAITSRLTHHHNLYADVMKRVTRFGNYNDNVVTRFDWYNNVVFNWGPESTYSNDNDLTWLTESRTNGSSGTDGEFVEINFLDNYFIAGPTTSWFKTYQGFNAANHKIWASGIFTDFDIDAQRDGANNGWESIGGSFTAMQGPFSIEAPYVWQDAETAYERVLAQAGASFVRDAVDERIVSQVKDCIGSVPDTQDDVGGFPALTELQRPAGFDTDGDGMPNDWETPRGLNPDNSADGASDSDGDGYTNLEEYLNFLAVRGGELLGDFDKDGDIDLEDLSTISANWLKNNCDDVPLGNLDYDCDVDFNDYAVFAAGWTG